MSEAIVARNQARHNHYDSKNVHHCRNCGGFTSPQEVDPGVLKYDCANCGIVYEPVKTSLRKLANGD